MSLAINMSLLREDGILSTVKVSYSQEFILRAIVVVYVFDFDLSCLPSSDDVDRNIPHM